MTALDNARAALAYIEPGPGLAAVVALIDEHKRVLAEMHQREFRAAQPRWEYCPGHRWVDRDGVERWFAQSGTIAPGYVDKYISEGGEVIRRVVGPWETVESASTVHTHESPKKAVVEDQAQTIERLSRDSSLTTGERSDDLG